MQVPLSHFTYLMLTPQENTLTTTSAPAVSDNEEIQLKQTTVRLTIVLPTAANENQRK
jgi:hypothetical protein